LLHVEIHTVRALVGILQDSLSCWGGANMAKLIAEEVSQEWRVGSKLELEGQHLIEVLLNHLLGTEKRVIGARDLKLGTHCTWVAHSYDNR